MATLSATSIHSENLASLRSLVDQNPLLKHFQGIFQLTVIIDANIILRDLLWQRRSALNQVPDQN